MYEGPEDAPRATLGDVADHIEHIRDVAGVDHVGIGSDFDGITDTPVGMEDVSTFLALFAELSRRGWSEEDLAKLAGGNVLRAWRESTIQRNLWTCSTRNLSTTMGHSTGLIREQCPVW